MMNEKLIYIAPAAEIQGLVQEDIVLLSLNSDSFDSDTQNIYEWEQKANW